MPRWGSSLEAWRRGGDLLRRLLVDGEPARPDSLPLTNRGLYYGDTVFETFRTREGKVFRLRRHLERLEGSATFLGFDVQPMSQHRERTAAFLERETRDADSVVRLTLLRPGEGRGLVATRGKGTHVIFEIEPLVNAVPPPRGVACTVSSVRRVNPYPGRPQIKTGSAQSLAVAKAEAAGRGAYEALMLNSRGLVAEGTSANVFMVEGGALVTPPITSDILPGITREAVMEVATAEGIPCAEEEFDPERLQGADEAFLTNAVAGMVRVTEIDGRKLGGDGGPSTFGKLAESFARLVAAELNTKKNG